MKITGIKFLNLNSLKGGHEIRFDRPPFTESGIFAITGPTGAGKTTLLDAITAALYGRVHRHSKDVFEIMTRHTAESYAEVEFEVAGQSYRAKWSIRRSRGKADGQLQTQKMELAEVETGKIIIEHPLNEVKEEIVRLCGLDYNQFLRSVILSQGDFTRFLKADENERSELLEKITDTGIYSEISVAAYEKARDERFRLEQLKGRLENVVMLTYEQRTAYQTELTELSLLELKVKEEETIVRAGLNWLENIEKLDLKKQQLIQELSAAELFHTSKEPQFLKLRQHQHALVYRPALAEVNTIENQLQQIRAELKDAELQYPEVFKAEKITSESLAVLKAQAIAKEKILTEKEPLFDLVGKKDLLIEQAKNQLVISTANLESASHNLQNSEQSHLRMSETLIGIQNQIAQLTAWLKNNTAESTIDKQSVVFQQLLQQHTALKIKSGVLTEEQSALEKQQQDMQVIRERSSQNITSAETQLSGNFQAIQQQHEALENLLAGKTTDGLEEELREFPLLIHTVEQQFKLAISYAKIVQEHSALTERLLILAEEEKNAKTKLDQLKLENEQGTEQFKNLQQIYELEARVQKYDAERLQLREEQPCPLCGAVHHPFVKGNYVSKVTEAEERRNRHQLKLQQLKTQVDAQLILLNSLSYQLETADKSLFDTAELLVQVEAEFSLNNGKLPKALEIFKPDIIAAVIGRKKTQQETLKKQLDAARSAQQQLVTLEVQLNQRKELLSAEKNKAEQAGLQFAFTEKQLKAVVEELYVFAEEIKILESRTTQLLEPFGIKFDPESAAQIIPELDRRYRYYQASEQELKRLELDLRQQETELKSLVKTITERKEAVQKSELQSLREMQALQQLQEERHQLFGLNDPILERARLTEELRALRLQTEELQQVLQQKREQLKIIEDRQLNLNITLESTTKLFSTQLGKLSEKLQKEDIPNIAALKELFLPEEEAKQFAEVQQESAQRINSGKSLLSATEKELEGELVKAVTGETTDVLAPRLEEKVREVSLLNIEKGKISRVIEEDDQLQLKHTEVARQIESQQQEFDRFQKLSALIGSADGKKFSRFAQGLTLARLTELANRHLLRLTDRYSILKSPEKDLDLQIVDGYQADVVRPMSTLSGGESFLVSLALALGLSDLASRKVQINSLFIDEGFGTLDAETLDVAITALENLQASGKNIGIISHVEALKERIGTQIQLTRQAGGTSKISIYSYGNKVI